MRIGDSIVSQLVQASLIAILLAGAAFSQVTVLQDTITLKTWNEGPPDINPWFELFPSEYYPMYPYTLRKTFLPDASNVAWRELTIENEYLYCRVLPDLGGHLYSCRDKIANVEMFYANPVIRKASVGLRGAWAALGIELNFPVGHSLVSVSPVSFGTQKHSDGSAGVWVAARPASNGASNSCSIRVRQCWNKMFGCTTAAMCGNHIIGGRTRP